MDVSPAGLHLIASWEGFVPVPYNDSADNATIGYGHLIHTGPVTQADRDRYQGWSSAQFLELLHLDAAAAVRAVSQSVKVRLGLLPARAQCRFDALCSLAFNIGGGGFATSHLVRQINLKGAPRNWSELGPLWLTWDHAGGVVVPGLLNRRRAEFAIFVAGAYPAHPV